MDYEKKYKEALAWMKDVYPTLEGAAKEDAEHYFPELKESIDERVKKVIRQVLNESTTEKDECYSDNGVTQQEVFVWLEKKGEQPTDEEMKTILRTEYEKGRADAIAEMQKPVNIDYISGIRKELLGIEDNAKNINSLTESQWVAIRAAHRLLGEYMAKEQNLAWSEEDENLFRCAIDAVREESMVRTDGCLDEEVGEMVTNWLKSLKNRVQPQQKQEWSEEDDIGLSDALLAVEQARTIAKDENDMGNLWYAERWLKSLKERIGE